MVLWFVILAPVIVAEVFRSPMVDYRLVAAGALLPVSEAVFDGPFLLHTLIGVVGALVLVMVATQGRRLRRRQLLGLPIGLLLHLVLDGTWTSKELLWWPAFGASLDALHVPETSRSAVTVVVMELAAVAVGAWAWRRYGLDDPHNRNRLRQTGQLSRSVLS